MSAFVVESFCESATKWGQSAPDIPNGSHATLTGNGQELSEEARSARPLKPQEKSGYRICNDAVQETRPRRTTDHHSRFFALHLHETGF